MEFKEATPGACQVDLKIEDHTGRTMFFASINRPAPGTLPKDLKDPVVVLKKATGEGLNRCFFRWAKDDRQAQGRPTIRICDMKQEAGQNSALLDVKKGYRETTWTIRHGNPVVAEYTIEGHFSNTVWATVKNDKGLQVAAAGAADGKHTAGKCQVSVEQGMDASLVLCALLGMGELESYRASPVMFTGT